MNFTDSVEDHERRSDWMEERTRERFKRRLRPEKVFARSRSTSPDVYREILQNYRKTQDSNRGDKKEESGVKKSTMEEGADDESREQFQHQDPDSVKNKGRGDNIESEDSDSDEEYGPKPLKINPSLEKKISFGAELLPGEADAIAQFIQKGKRVPRRGEVGLTSDDIEKFEKIGYVMSGSRHKSINAMRIKKESMVLTAEQEKARALEKYQERMNRENEIVNHFREVLRRKREEEGMSNE